GGRRAWRRGAWASCGERGSASRSGRKGTLRHCSIFVGFKEIQLPTACHADVDLDHGLSSDGLRSLRALLRANPSKDGDAELRGYGGSPPCSPGRQRSTTGRELAA